MKNLSLKQTITIPETDVTLDIDVSDKAFIARLLNLATEFGKYDSELEKKLVEVTNREDLDEIGKIVKGQLIQAEALKDLKDKVNETFGSNITDRLFGEDVVPDVDRYLPLLETVIPVVQQGIEEDQKRKQAAEERAKFLNEKYGIARIK